MRMGLAISYVCGIVLNDHPHTCDIKQSQQILMLIMTYNQFPSLTDHLHTCNIKQSQR
jgi:hypothetical protein